MGSKKIFLSWFAISGIVFLSLPFPAMAGSCKCKTVGASHATVTDEYKCFIYEPNKYSPNYQPKKTDSQGDCDALNASGPNWSISECKYFDNPTCYSTEGATMTPTDKTCQTDLDCQQSQGVAKCQDSKCYMDGVALLSFRNQVGTSPIDLKAPSLEIRIPGVVFDETKNTVDANGYIHVSYIGSYLSGVYKFALGAGSILAVIVIIMNGFRVTVSGGGEERNIGIQNIAKALTGLFILWTSYLLLFTINPDLTQFKPISVKYVSFEPKENEDESVSGTEVDPSTLVEASGDNFDAGKNLETGARIQVSADLQKALQVAAASLKNQGIALAVASGYRSEKKQKELIDQNCNNPPGSPTCDHKPGKPITCMLVGGSKGCPHTTGHAVDVWGVGKKCAINGDQRQCNSDLKENDPCRLDACQAAVIKAMRDAGFCNLSFEPWHFEKPAMSKTCN